MSDFKIRDISFYNFLFIIFGLILISGVLYLSLKKIKDLNDKLSTITISQNFFLEMKLNSETLLTTTSLKDRKEVWIKSADNFDKELQKLQKLKILNELSLLNLWEIAKEKSDKIYKLLDNDLLYTIDTMQKPILVLKGELSTIDNKNEEKLSQLISSIIVEVRSLIKDEREMFTKFKQMYKLEKSIIDQQIYNTVYIATVLIIFIFLTLVGLISIFNRKISLKNL